MSATTTTMSTACDPLPVFVALTTGVAALLGDGVTGGGDITSASGGPVSVGAIAVGGGVGAGADRGVVAGLPTDNETGVGLGVGVGVGVGVDGLATITSPCTLPEQCELQ